MEDPHQAFEPPAQEALDGRVTSQFGPYQELQRQAMHPAVKALEGEWA